MNNVKCTSQMFKTASAAKCSLTKLLKVMDEYLADKFFLVETDQNNKIVSEIAYTAKVQLYIES